MLRLLIRNFLASIGIMAALIICCVAIVVGFVGTIYVGSLAFAGGGYVVGGMWFFGAIAVALTNDDLREKENPPAQEIENVQDVYLDALVEVVREIYFAGHWHCDRPVENEARLWARLRDAAGITPGMSPKKIDDAGNF